MNQRTGISQARGNYRVGSEQPMRVAVRNAANRKDVVLMSTATLLDFATLTKTVYLQLENIKIIISAQEVSKNYKINTCIWYSYWKITHTNALVYCCL